MARFDSSHYYFAVGAYVVMANGRHPVDMSKPNNYPMSATSISIPVFFE